jgi:hypothetical protein
VSLTLTKKTILLLFLLLLSLAFTVPNGPLAPAHAVQTGEVCIADPTSAVSTSPCPASTPTFDGPKSQQIKFGIYVQNSYNVTGFDITLYTNHSFLAPVGVDLTGSVVPGQKTIILECMQDIVKAGQTACSPYDSVDTLHFTVAGGLGLHTNPGTSGLLFTAIYDITGTTVSGGIPLGYQNGTRVPPNTPPGCTGSSVGNFVCVTIAGGSSGADPETAQSATFDNSNIATTPYVTESAPKSIGPQFPGVSGTATITANSQNGYASCAPFCAYADNVTFSTVGSVGLTATISSPNFCSTAGTSCSVTLSASAGAAGNYTVTVYGTYATADPSGNLDTLICNITLTVVVDDFGLSVNPTTLFFVFGSTGQTTITLSSLNGFTGSLTLSTGSPIVPSTTPPLAVTYSSSPVTLAAGQIVFVNATFSSGTASTVYHVPYIRATSGSRFKSSGVLTVNTVSGDASATSVACSPSTVVSNAVSSCTAIVTDTSSSPVTPTGGVYFTSNGLGSFTPGSCSLGTQSSSTATCSVNYSPSSAGKQTILASYAGDTSHGTSQNKTSLTVVAATSTSVQCSAVLVGYTSACAASVFDTSSSPSTPTGIVTFATNSTGTFTPSNSCTLSPATPAGNSTCSLSYSPTVGGHHLITGSYPGDAAHSGSSKAFSLLVSLVPTSTSVKCSPTTMATSASTTCNVIVLDTSSNPTTPTGTVSFATNSSGTFTPSSASCGLAQGSMVGNATCMISYSPSVGGNHTIAGSYLGDTVHAPSSGQALLIVAGFKLFPSPSKVVVNSGILGNSTITAVAYNGFTGTVTLTKTPQSGLTCSLSQNTILLGSLQNSILSCSASNTIDYSVTVSGTSGSTTYSTIVQYQITSFSISVSPVSISVPEGTKGSTNVTITSNNGFSGIVTLKLNVTTGIPNPLLPTATLAKYSVNVPSNGMAVVSFNVTVGPQALPNTYGYIVNGTNGGFTDQHIIIVVVPRPDFSITASPSAAIVLVPGQTGVANITVTAVDGFNGTVAFSYAPSASGLTCTFSRSNVKLLPGGANFTLLTCGGVTASQPYVVTVTGTPTETYTTITHVASPEPVYSVVDFTLSSIPNGITLNTGDTGHAQINVTWTAGYTGTVTLKAVANNGAVTVTIPGTITGHSGVITLDVVSTAAGSYNIVVNATSGSDVHTITITLTVIAATPANTIFGLDPTVFYSIVGVVAAAVVVLAALLFRRRKPVRKK